MKGEAKKPTWSVGGGAGGGRVGGVEWWLSKGFGAGAEHVHCVSNAMNALHGEIGGGGRCQVPDVNVTVQQTRSTGPQRAKRKARRAGRNEETGQPKRQGGGAKKSRCD